MSIKRLVRETRTIMAVPLVEIDGVANILYGAPASPSIVPFAAPTAAALNFWLAVTTPSAVGAGIGGNISRAIRDNANLGLAASQTEQNPLITSVGNEVDTKFAQVNAVLECFRDVDDRANGVWNLASNLFRVKGSRYALVDRIQGGKKWNTAFAAADVVSLYGVRTDAPVDNVGDQQYVSFTQNFKPTGLINPEYSLLS
ncbi:hypothetical protein [Agromyces sp. NPDC058104]|uniref:phage tail tube protein n=1 Tax=Agromyces sp. NPDC058104 TaxID=3346342 RepID=UPI0036DA9032